MKQLLTKRSIDETYSYPGSYLRDFGLKLNNAVVLKMPFSDINIMWTV